VFMRVQQRYLLNRALLVEGALLAIALAWAFVAKIPLRQMCAPNAGHLALGVGLGCALLAVNLFTLTVGARYCAWCRRMKSLIEHDVAPLFRGFSVWAALMLAALSGISEEILFRGVLQTQFGLIAASIIFGLAHIWRRDAVVYGVYATVIGAGFGLVYLLTQNLCAPILAHAVNNVVAILYCARLSPCTDESLPPQKFPEHDA
jgi:uncharacterized protein